MHTKQDPKIQPKDRDPKFKIKRKISNTKDSKNKTKIIYKARDPKIKIQKRDPEKIIFKN